MKRFLMLLLVFAIPVFFSACGNNSNDAEIAPENTESEKAVANDDGHGDDGHDDAGGHNGDGHDDTGNGDDSNGDGGHHGDDTNGDGGHHGDADAHDAKPHGHDSVAGKPGDSANVDRTVEVSLDDTMRFTPDQLTVAAGDTVRFVLQNNGKVPHEFVIGSMAELLEHAEMMRSMPDMQHAESNMITLAAGEQGEIVWQFDASGKVDFACLLPGHLEAGMKGSITVE